MPIKLLTDMIDTNRNVAKIETMTTRGTLTLLMLWMEAIKFIYTYMCIRLDFSFLLFLFNPVAVAFVIAPVRLIKRFFCMQNNEWRFYCLLEQLLLVVRF